MRRLLLPLAGLAALSCASAPSGASRAAPADAPAPLAGFERQPGETVAEYDLTHDGKPDLWKYSLRDAAGKEVPVRKERDLNADGKVDSWERFAPDGSLVRVAHDLDFDGKPDEILLYEKDQLVRKDLALGFDGVPRAWSHYEKGKLVRKERDTNGDGKVDTWEYWENGEVDRIGVDLDGDGVVDRWEARASAELPPAPAGAPSTRPEGSVAPPRAEPKGQK